jgi:hypothetical protein
LCSHAGHDVIEHHAAEIMLERERESERARDERERERDERERDERERDE